MASDLMNTDAETLDAANTSRIASDLDTIFAQYGFRATIYVLGLRWNRELHDTLQTFHMLDRRRD